MTTNKPHSPPSGEPSEHARTSEYAEPVLATVVRPAESDLTGGLIPYHNVLALVAYYLAVFSLIPLFGFFLGVGAAILGVRGLREYRRNPAIRGSVHARIGVVMGTVMALVWGGMIAALIWAAFWQS